MKEALMRKCLLCVVLASTALVLLQCSSGGSSGTTVSPASQMLGLINKNRNPDYKLKMDPAISAVAREYAHTLGNYYYPGTGPYIDDADGGSPNQRLVTAGVTGYSAVAETGSGPANASTAYANMSSATLNNTSYTHVGIGTYLCDA
jgi:hypothetical protein